MDKLVGALLENSMIVLVGVGVTCATDAQTQENRMSAWRTAMVVYLADRVNSVTARCLRKDVDMVYSLYQHGSHAMLSSLTSPVQSNMAGVCQVLMSY